MTHTMSQYLNKDDMIAALQKENRRLREGLINIANHCPDPVWMAQKTLKFAED